ncbi:hypothetical protein AMTRI_Chr02g263540 [Amborella trichopoda]
MKYSKSIFLNNQLVLIRWVSNFKLKKYIFNTKERIKFVNDARSQQLIIRFHDWECMIKFKNKFFEKVTLPSKIYGEALSIIYSTGLFGLKINFIWNRLSYPKPIHAG